MKKPARYENVKPEDLPKEILALVKTAKETRRGIYIFGPVGSGKTHIAYAIAEYAEQELKTVVQVYNVTEMLASFRSDFDQHWSNRENIDRRLKEFKGLLILDDIGAEKPTEWVAETLYRIINQRYNDMLPTVFTSNLSLSELAPQIGDRTASRIAGGCDVVQLTGDDRRVTGSKITL